MSFSIVAKVTGAIAGIVIIVWAFLQFARGISNPILQYSSFGIAAISAIVFLKEYAENR